MALVFLYYFRLFLMYDSRRHGTQNHSHPARSLVDILGLFIFIYMSEGWCTIVYDVNTFSVTFSIFRLSIYFIISLNLFRGMAFFEKVPKV